LPILTSIKIPISYVKSSILITIARVGAAPETDPSASSEIRLTIRTSCEPGWEANGFACCSLTVETAKIAENSRQKWRSDTNIDGK
jgi:hypothetical protein